MKKPCPHITESSLSILDAGALHPNFVLLVGVLGAVGFTSLLLSEVAVQTVDSAFQGFGFICLGLAGAIYFVHAWWCRLPIKIKGGLSPDRPFFYHLGSAFLIGTSFLLIIAGSSQIKGWLFQ